MHHELQRTATDTTRLFRLKTLSTWYVFPKSYYRCFELQSSLLTFPSIRQMWAGICHGAFFFFNLETPALNPEVSVARMILAGLIPSDPKVPFRSTRKAACLMPLRLLCPGQLHRSCPTNQPGPGGS